MARTISEEHIGLAHLDELGRELTDRGYLTMIVTAGIPRLDVLNRTDPERHGTVLCERGAHEEERWFWWSWADRIAPVTDLRRAADLIDRFLSGAAG
ncbi:MULTISPECIES: hypothetical protein [Thermomonospora]|uniref:Uncharacterized protein n=1 Tax=Thermomonospora curvata (strain ATCC 19995 / DSM 43183 / JCM 3096 / KCTC 9072 / NBRC 15933 / NCIMB 10081 / Henssen B9) TaxID=471852 RepID=D1A517_THECD|nr:MULTISPECIES: hypothetical protein [Thermomonospora]ACY98186.1 hypothetical protein Tcur_2632 [Thermomonospora curvata DSM 43183]PKK13958.1 MAG: hypothetical protein BUE48_012855 [Thermomonospora sp. CIF 1]